MRNSKFSDYLTNLSPFKIYESNSNNKFLISNCVFKNMISISKGGVFLFSNIKIKVFSSYFFKNRALENGGVIFMTCEQKMLVFCNYKLINNIFEQNLALISGGGYYLEYSKPLELNNIFIKNTAEISRNYFGSFFCRLGFQFISVKNNIENILFDSANSNSSNELFVNNIDVFSKSLFFRFYPLDFYLQKTNLNDVEKLSVFIEFSDQNLKICKKAEIFGKTSQVLDREKHYFLFDNLKIMACRNMRLILNFSIGNTNFSFPAFDLNNSKNEIIDGTSYSIVVPLYLNLCSFGEVFDFNLFHCLLCPENFFSFNPEDMNCHPCLEKFFLLRRS